MCVSEAEILCREDTHSTVEATAHQETPVLRHSKCQGWSLQREAGKKLAIAGVDGQRALLAGVVDD